MRLDGLLLLAAISVSSLAYADTAKHHPQADDKKSHGHDATKADSGDRGAAKGHASGQSADRPRDRHAARSDSRRNVNGRDAKHETKRETKRETKHQTKSATRARFAGRQGLLNRLSIAPPQHHSGSFVAWFGPVFWPFAYDDLFTYTFWPADSPDLRGAFFDDAATAVVDGAFDAAAPQLAVLDASAGADRDVRSPLSGGRSRAGVRGLAAYSRRFAQICGNRTPSLKRWPLDRLAAMLPSAAVLPPAGPQRGMLDELSAASAKTVSMLMAACPNENPKNLPAHLAAMEARLSAARQAARLIRPAVERLDAALTEDQRALFAAAPPDPRSGPPDVAAPSDDGPAAKPPRSCGQEAGFADQTLRRIRTATVPNGEQVLALRSLQAALSRAVNILRTGCPTALSPTPTGRVAALEIWLDATLVAIRMERAALDRLWSGLSEDQRMRLTGTGRLPTGHRS